MYISKILSAKYPECSWVVEDENYEKLEWSDENTTPKPTLQELEALWDEVQNLEKWKEFRRTRNDLLSRCDWIILKSYSRNEPVPEEWKTYMQALRDLPANTTDPENPVWPEAPTP